MKSSKKHTPGFITQFLLKLFTPKDQRLEVEGDFWEIFSSINKRDGLNAARNWYRKQVIKSIPVFIKQRILWSCTLLKNYLKSASRSLLKDKITNLLSVSGLVLALTSSSLIMLWTLDELNFDNYHKNPENIYRIDSIMKYGGRKNVWAVTPAPLGVSLKSNFPEIEEAATLKQKTFDVNYKEKVFQERSFFLGTPSILKILKFDFETGDPASALDDPDSIIITKSRSIKYFGSSNPLGKILVVDNRYSFKITGVIKDTPHNTHLKPDFIIPFENIRKIGERDLSWSRYDFITYITLKDRASSTELSRKISNHIKRFDKNSSTTLKMLPLLDIHLNPDNGTGSINYIYIFIIIGIMILLVASINFINLSTANFTTRAKGLGIRKTLGASKKNLILQVYTESFILTLTGFTFSLVSTLILLPLFSEFTGKNFLMESLFDTNILVGQIILLVFTALVSGTYPALILSSVNPVKIFKSSHSGDTKKGLMEKLLIIPQFTISIGLIICTLNVRQQLEYLKNKDLGFETDHICYLKIGNRQIDRVDPLKISLNSLPNVLMSSASSRVPTNISNFSMVDNWEGKTGNDSIMFNIIETDHNYLKIMKIGLKSGSDFSIKTPEKSLIINQEAVRKLGIKSPIGKKIYLWGGEYSIVGVAKNFHFTPLSKKIKPLMIMLDRSRANRYLFLKIRSNDIFKTLENIKAKYQNIMKYSPFSLVFLEDAINRLYINEQKTSILLEIFSILGIVTSCFGLFGLSAFTARKRIKEIGIRKILGASQTGLIISMGKEFLILILLSNLLAWPLSYSFISRWLENYAYKTDISAETFIFSTLIATFLGLLTIGYHTLSSSSVNPVECIRNQ